VLFAVLPRAVGVNGEVLERAVMVPVGCHGDGALEGGQRCLSLLREGSAVGIEGGEALVPTGRAQPYCPGGYPRGAGLALPGDVSPGFAVWPAKRVKEVTVPAKGLPWKPTPCKGWCTFGRAGHPRVRVSAEQHQRLAAAARTAGMPPGAGTLEVLQEFALDLDGDGKPERFYSVAAPDPDTEDYVFRFSALIMEPAAGRPMVIRRQDSAAVVLRGAVDLDGDGRKELWLLLTPTQGDGIAHDVVQVGPYEAVVIGGYRCRPR